MINLILIVVFIAIILLAVMRVFGFLEGNRPANLGLTNNQFQDCPNKRNCVSSYSKIKIYYIEPLPYTLSAEQSIKKINAALKSINGLTIITNTSNYTHAESKSLLLGFVDDVEIFCDAEEQQCFVRSASRLGRSDFGVNRKRIEKIRMLLDSSIN